MMGNNVLAEVAMALDGHSHSDISTVINQMDLPKGVVVVTPYSDDNMEFDGAIRDEIGGYGGIVVKLDHNGIVKPECDNEDCPHELERQQSAPFYIIQLWCQQEGFTWTYDTNIPDVHRFHIRDDEGEDGYFGEGLVFHLDSLHKTDPVTEHLKNVTPTIAKSSASLKRAFYVGEKNEDGREELFTL